MKKCLHTCQIGEYIILQKLLLLPSIVLVVAPGDGDDKRKKKSIKNKTGFIQDKF